MTDVKHLVKIRSALIFAALATLVFFGIPFSLFYLGSHGYYIDLVVLLIFITSFIIFLINEYE